MVLSGTTRESSRGAVGEHGRDGQTVKEYDIRLDWEWEGMMACRSRHAAAPPVGYGVAILPKCLQDAVMLFGRQGKG